MEEEEHGGFCDCKNFNLGQTEDNINHTVELAKVRALNSVRNHDFSKLFRIEEDKYKFEPDFACCSFPQDPELVVIVSFKEAVRLRAIDLIFRKPDVASSVSVFVNQENFAFKDTQQTPTEAFELNHFTQRGEVEIYPDLNKMGNVSTIAIYFRGLRDQIALQYIGFKGFGTKNKKLIFKGNFELISTDEDTQQRLQHRMDMLNF